MKVAPRQRFFVGCFVSLGNVPIKVNTRRKNTPKSHTYNNNTSTLLGIGQASSRIITPPRRVSFILTVPRVTPTWSIFRLWQHTQLVIYSPRICARLAGVSDWGFKDLLHSSFPCTSRHSSITLPRPPYFPPSPLYFRIPRLYVYLRKKYPAFLLHTPCKGFGKLRLSVFGVQNGKWSWVESCSS